MCKCLGARDVANFETSGLKSIQRYCMAPLHTNWKGVGVEEGGSRVDGFSRIHP